MSNNSGLIKDAVITLVGGKVYSDDITGARKGGVRIAILVNQGSEDLEATFSLESWDKDLATWIPEPMAIFKTHATGVKAELVDTFKTTHAEKYRVGIDPTGGTAGPVKMSWSHNL